VGLTLASGAVNAATGELFQHRPLAKGAVLVGVVGVREFVFGLMRFGVQLLQRHGVPVGFAGQQEAGFAHHLVNREVGILFLNSDALGGEFGGQVVEGGDGGWGGHFVVSGSCCASMNYII